jgi:hypothetical protein
MRQPELEILSLFSTAQGTKMSNLSHLSRLSIIRLLKIACDLDEVRDRAFTQLEGIEGLEHCRDVLDGPSARDKLEAHCQQSVRDLKLAAALLKGRESNALTTITQGIQDYANLTT